MRTPGGKYPTRWEVKYPAQLLRAWRTVEAPRRRCAAHFSYARHFSGRSFCWVLLWGHFWTEQKQITDAPRAHLPGPLHSSTVGFTNEACKAGGKKDRGLAPPGEYVLALVLVQGHQDAFMEGRAEDGMSGS